MVVIEGARAQRPTLKKTAKQETYKHVVTSERLRSECARGAMKRRSSAPSARAVQTS